MSTAICRSLPFAALILLCGCGKSFNYDGTWQGNRNLAVPPGGDRYLMHTVGKVKLIIKDNRFELVEAGMPTSGSISFGDGKALLNTERIIDQPLESQGKDAARMHPAIQITPQPDGTLLFDDPGSPVPGKLVLKKDPVK